MLLTNCGNKTGMAVTPLINRHVSPLHRPVPEPVLSSSYCHNIFLQLPIFLAHRPLDTFKRFLYTSVCVRVVIVGFRNSCHLDSCCCWFAIYHAFYISFGRDCRRSQQWCSADRGKVALLHCMSDWAAPACLFCGN